MTEVFVPSLLGVLQQVLASQVKYAMGLLFIYWLPPELLLACRHTVAVSRECVCVCWGGTRGGEALMSRGIFRLCSLIAPATLV